MFPTERVQLKYTGTALPTAASTVNFFDTTQTGVRGFLALARANRFEITIQNDQALTLKAYWSDDFGTNWNQYDSQSVAIPSANNSSGPYDYLIDEYKDWKLDGLIGGSNETTFRVNMSLIVGQRSVGA